MAKNTIKTKKVTHTSWNTLDRDTRKRALQQILGIHFRDYMVEDSLNKDFIFWAVIETKARIVTDPKSPYKVIVNSTSCVR